MFSSSLKFVKCFLAISLCYLLIGYNHLFALAELNRTAIIPQSEVDYNGIRAVDINNFLLSTGSQLANYVIPESYGVYFPIGRGQWDRMMVPQQWQPTGMEMEIYWGKTVAELVYEWSTINKPSRPGDIGSPGQINPLIILATMDKESASVIGNFRNNIISERPITTSWLMGYGYDGVMANCASNGDCNIDYNRQRAQWYGGPGQQIVEATSFFKLYSTNPQKMGDCPGDWHSYRVSNGAGTECVTVENSISYALYRFTPSFSGQELFVNRYNIIKSTFTYPPPPPPPDETANDVGLFSQRTYDDSVTVAGGKSARSRAYYGEVLLSDFDNGNWQVKIPLLIGDHDYTIDYKRADGSLINQKVIRINRHRLGDINGDGKVDLLDLSILANYWGHTDPKDSMVNLNPQIDTVVDIMDLSILANNWSE